MHRKTINNRSKSCTSTEFQQGLETLSLQNAISAAYENSSVYGLHQNDQLNGKGFDQTRTKT